MPGQPQKRAIITALEQRTRQEFSDEPEATHLDYVELWQASGRTLNDLGEEIGLGPKKGEAISRYLHKVFGNEAATNALRNARARGAHSLVEDTLDIADRATEDDIGVARLRVQARQWTAEKWNPAEFGRQGNNVNVQLNLGELHLAALQKYQQPPHPVIEAHAEVIELPAAATEPNENP